MESGRGGPGPGRYTNRQKGRHRHAQRQSHHPQTHTGVARDRTGGGRWLTASLPGHSEALTLPYAVGDKKAGHLTHVHNSKCTCGHACPRTHTATHTVSHTWQLPNRPQWHTHHMQSRGGQSFTQAQSHRCAGSPPRAHTHNSTLLRSLINTPGTALHTQARSGTHRPSGTRLADAPAEPSHTGADPELWNYIPHTYPGEHIPHMLQVTQRQTSPRARIFGQRPRGSGTCQPTVTLGDGLTKSHAHRCTGTKFWCDRRSHAR